MLMIRKLKLHLPPNKSAKIIRQLKYKSVVRGIRATLFYVIVHPNRTATDVYELRTEADFFQVHFH